MTDIAIATAAQSPNFSQVAAGKDNTAGGNQGFFDMLLASSSHNLANASLLFIAGSALDATLEPSQTFVDDDDALPLESNDIARREPAERDESDDSLRATEYRGEERREENASDEAVGLRETAQTPAERRAGAEQGAEDAAQAAPNAAPKNSGSPSTAAEAAVRDVSAKPVAPEMQTAAATATQGKMAKADAAEKPSGQFAASVKTEAAGLVSKPQQALAQAAAVTAQEKPKVVQGLGEASGTDPEVDPELRVGNEPLIKRPTAKLQAGAQTPQQTAQSSNAANAPMAGLAAETAMARNAQSAVSSSTLGSANAVAAGAPKMAPLATGLTATAPQSMPTGEGKAATPGSFAANLKSTPETFQQLSLQMSRAAALGRDRISLQLHPAELGRVDVKLEFAQDQSMRAIITAERPETLDLLQRDSRILERALQDAGVKLDNNSLNFAQRNDQQPSHHGQSGDGEPLASAGADGESDTTEAMPSAPSGDANAGSGAVNIRV